MSKKLASVEIHYRQNKSTSLDVSRKVPQWVANQLAITYLNCMEIVGREKKAKALGSKRI